MSLVKNVLPSVSYVVINTTYEDKVSQAKDGTTRSQYAPAYKISKLGKFDLFARIRPNYPIVQHRLP